MLPNRWTWGLVAFALLCFGALFGSYRPLPLSSSHADHMRIHMEGMWVAFGVTAAFIVYFLMRITAALAERESELASARNLAARHQQVASLASLAASTAHELATPLSTVAVAASELERTLADIVAHGNGITPILSAARIDAQLIQRQLQHCRDILNRMSLAGGEFVGERLTALTGRELIQRALAEVAPLPSVRTIADVEAADAQVEVPPNALAEGLRCLIRNAQEASPSDRVVTVRTSLESEYLQISIHDDGVGMPDDVLRRAGEPFFTTKGVGKGMGLGLFITRALLEQLGGSLRLSSTSGSGTTASVRLPRIAARAATRDAS